jgi:RNA polymerase sigma factor (sigma-70 family)
MDVNSTTTTHPGSSHGGGLSRRRVGEILGAWQVAETRIARRFPECRGLSSEQLEDLYQETVIALLARPYTSEAHLCNALRQGIKHRALNLHRDLRRRGQILAEHAPSIHRVAQESATSTSPENMAMLGEDRSVILAFLAELDPFERHVFELTAEGLRYRAIAKRLRVDVNEARRAARSVERKRIQFRLRHDLDWEPHARARRAGSMLVAPLPAITAGLVSARRWLFGQGLSAKASAAVAVAAIATAGALHATSPAPRRPDRGGSRKTAPSTPRLAVAQRGRDVMPPSTVALPRWQGTRSAPHSSDGPRRDATAAQVAPPQPTSDARRSGAPSATRGAEFGFEVP